MQTSYARGYRVPVAERLTLVLSDGVVEHVFYPVFPPDEHADEVVRWLETHPVE